MPLALLVDNPLTLVQGGVLGLSAPHLAFSALHWSSQSLKGFLFSRREKAVPLEVSHLSDTGKPS